jgi:uncharacterized protein (TIGR02594 family)
MEPAWLRIARDDIGTRETRGAMTTPKIAGWLLRLRAWWRDDETPWCGVAVAAWMQAAGLALPKHWYRARAWLDWGVRLAGPALGCVVVFQRPGGGHVGLVVGIDAQHRLMVLGGNQGDAVNIRPFDQSRVLGYRWPAEASRDRGELPLLASTGPASRNEA